MQSAASHTVHRLTLRSLPVGQSAIVIAIHHHVPAVRQKYLSRGIVPGAHIMLLHGGDPVVVALDESRWAIAGNEAEDIEVAPVGARVARAWWQQLLRLARHGRARP